MKMKSGLLFVCLDKMWLFSCFTLLYLLYFSLVGEFYHFISSESVNIFSKNNNNKKQICICFHIILAVQNTRKMATVKKRKPGDGLSICYNDVRLIHLKKYFPL